MRVGFLGLGRMGEPMAANLLAAGHELLVWNRSAPARARLNTLGATIVADAQDVLREAEATIEMLATEAVIDEVLRIRDGRLGAPLAGRGLIHMSTTSPECSLRLGRAVRASGGWYVEAPVSGSRVPAEQGRLVAMVAGDAADLDRIEPLLSAMCAQVVRCGEPPAAALMKLAVNVYLIGIVTALAEAWNYAACLGLDLEVFATALRSGQMSSAIATVKLDKLTRADYSPQASIPDVLKNARLIDAAGAARGIALPLHDACLELLSETVALGDDDLDMIGVIRAIQRRSAPR